MINLSILDYSPIDKNSKLLPQIFGKENRIKAIELLSEVFK